MAKHIAEEASVSETTANKHLQRLVAMNIVRTIESETGRRYEPDPLYARFRTLRRLIDEHDHQELLERKAELQGAIEQLEATYDVNSPTELRKCAARLDSSAETMERIQDASDWQLTRYHLSIVEDAIHHYSEYAEIDGRARV